MKKLAFLLSHPSHQIATFSLARKAQDQNYQVLFLGPSEGPSGENLTYQIKLNGFKYLELDIYASKKNSHEYGKFQNFIENLLNPSIFLTFFSKLKIDLLILDIFYAPIAIILYSQKIPFALASTIILADQDTFVPPLDNYHVPENTNTNIIKNQWDILVESKKEMFGKYYELLQIIAKPYGFDLDKYFYWSKSIVPFGFDFPELIFWDIEFDFPRTPDKLYNKYYLGNQVYNDVVYSEPFIADENYANLIYVNLGSKDNTKSKAKSNFYDELIKVAVDNPDLFFVISVPSEYQSKVAKPANIHYCNYCPQIPILKKSSLMLTHAGGSVKECIRHGIPMLCYPVDNDQFGNSARVVYHGLGMVGDIYKSSSDSIEKLIRKILNNKEIKDRIKYFQKRAITAENSLADLHILENITDYWKTS